MAHYPRVIARGARLPILKTERLTLRDIRLEDISEHYVAWLNNPEVTRYLEIRFTPQTENRVREYIKASLDDTRTKKHFGVYDQDGQRLVGTVTLPKIDWNHACADLSFVIGHPEARGRGYATEAVGAVVHYAFVHCGIVKLVAGYYDGHVGSARVLAKNGFEVEGRLRKKNLNHEGQRVDGILVGLLAEDYIERADACDTA